MGNHQGTVPLEIISGGGSQFKEEIMSEAYEYGEEDFEEEELDEEDEMRMAILEAEANEVWQEEPGDEEDEANLPLNPLFGLFSHGIPGNFGVNPQEKKENE